MSQPLLTQGALSSREQRSFSNSGRFDYRSDGSTFDPTYKNLFVDIYLSAAKPVNVEVLGIVKDAFMIPVRGMAGLHFLRDGGWIFAQVFCNIFKYMISI